MKNLQIVIDKTMPEFANISNQGVGACLKLTGEVVKSQGNKQPIEMLVNKPDEHVAKLVGESNPSEYVLHKSRPTLEYLRDIAHLRPRTNAISAVARIRNSLAFATHQFFQQRGFMYIHTPIS